tara:strand:- start:652 stop:822 length:171 start_codon:yes stop_codon:yes gene_type:complete
MPKSKAQNKAKSSNDKTTVQKTSSKTAKIVLFVFGIGPLILMCLFLFSNGFFTSPG